MPSRSGSLAVSLKTRVQQYFPGSHNHYRIQIDSGALQDFGVGEVLAPVVSGGSQVRVRMLLGSLGRHRAACPFSGELRRIGKGGREAGTTVRCNVKLMEMIEEDVAIDEREIEVQASLPPIMGCNSLSTSH